MGRQECRADWLLKRARCTVCSGMWRLAGAGAGWQLKVLAGLRVGLPWGLRHSTAWGCPGRVMPGHTDAHTLRRRWDGRLLLGHCVPLVLRPTFCAV